MYCTCVWLPLAHLSSVDKLLGGGGGNVKEAVCVGGCYLDILCVYCTPLHSAVSTTCAVDCVSWCLSLNIWLVGKHHVQVVSATRPLLAVYARAFACVRFNIHSVCIQYTVQTQFLYS